MKDRAVCPECDRNRPVRLDGHLVVHRNVRERRQDSLDCPGSGRRVRTGGLASDAEARGYQKAIDLLRAAAAETMKRVNDLALTDRVEGWDQLDSAADYLEVMRDEEPS